MTVVRSPFIHAYHRLLTSRLGSRISNRLLFRAIAKRELTWQDLPEAVRRNLCATYLVHTLKADQLLRLRQLLERSGFDDRLAGLVIKGSCDLQAYSPAYQLLERCVVSRTRETIANMQSPIARSKLELKLTMQGYVHFLRAITGLWEYLDIESRRDTVDRHSASDELRQLLRFVCQEYPRVAASLSPNNQSKLVMALLDLVRLISDEPLVDEVARLFFASEAKNAIGSYSHFTRVVSQKGIYFRHRDHRQHYVEDFSRWLRDKVPDEAAFFAHLSEQQRAAEARAAITGSESPAQGELRLRSNLVVALDMAGMDDLVVRVVGQTLQRAPDPVSTIEYCARFVRLRNDPARAMAFRALRSACQNPQVTGSNVSQYLTAFLLLADRDHIAMLFEQGWLHPRHGLKEYDLALAYAMLCKFDQSLEHLRNVKDEARLSFAEHATQHSFGVALGQERMLDEQAFLKATNDILNEIPQPRAPRGIVVLVAKNAHELNAYPILALRELKQRGFAIVSLVSGLLDYHPTGIPDIDRIADQMNTAMDHARWEDEPGGDGEKQWETDFQARRIAYDGVDVYWGIREDLGLRERRYSIDFEDPSKRSALTDNMRRIEMFEVCLRHVAEAGRRLQLPVRIILHYVHLGSHFYARRYVQALAEHQDISLLHVANAYENYFANFQTDEATTIAVRDMTLHKDLAGAYFAPVESFECYYRQLSADEKEQIVDKVDKWTKQHRVQRQLQVGQSDRLDFLTKERQSGKKIVGLLGKVLFDLEMPYGDGPAHADMREWFDHTVEIARANPHLHLVIKPHPHEVREEIALYATEVLQDWLPADMPSNVHFLGHNEFNLFELAEVLDLALLWNGTSALELGVLGVPTIVGAYYGHINFPAGHILPVSRAHYEQLIAAPDTPIPSAEVRLRAAALINYLRHPDHSIPYRYTHRGFTNRSIRNLRWFEQDLRAYRANGDPNVTKIADRIAAGARPPSATRPSSE